MKTTRAFWAMVVVVLLAPSLCAQEPDLQVTGEAAIGANDVNAKDGEAARFYEYREIPDGPEFSLFDIRLKTADYYLRLKAEDAGQSDERYDLAYNRYGKFRLDYRWDRIPHNFSYGAVTPYTEASPGVWTLPDGLQSQLQGILGDNGTNLPQAMDVLSDALANAHGTPLGLERRRQELDVDYSLSAPMTLSLHYQDESKEGYRAIGAPLGFGNVIELPETVDQNTRQGEIKLSYAKKNMSMDFGIAPSEFENSLSRMLWDNPYRLTDQTPPGKLTYLLGNGSGAGQMALAPNNEAARYFFNGSFKVLKTTRIRASLSYTQLTQDADLLPYTVNTGLEEAYAGALSAPRETADLGADIANAAITLHSAITRSLALNAGYTYYDYDDASEALSIPGHAILDQNWVDEPMDIGYLSYTRESYYANLAWTVWNFTTIEGGYKSKSMERERGDDYEGKNTEDILYLAATTAPLDWLSFRGTYSVSDRDWSLENGGNVVYPVRNDALFAFRRYHEAEREREELTLNLTLMPMDNLGFSFIYLTALNDYEQSQYGLESDDHRSFSFDANYTLGKHNFYAFYGEEENEGLQSARQTTFPPHDVISNDPLNDWTAILADDTTTYGGGLDLAFMNDRMHLNLSYSYSKTDGKLLLSSPEGGNPDAAINFTEGLDSTEYTVAKAQLIYKFNDRLKMSIGEWYEEYTLDDIFRSDIEVDMVHQGYAFYLGASDPDYKYLVSFVQLIYSW